MRKLREIYIEIEKQHRLRLDATEQAQTAAPALDFLGHSNRKGFDEILLDDTPILTRFLIGFNYLSHR